MENKISELEDKLSKADVNKVELQKRIQNAFLQGLATIDEEVTDEPKNFSNVAESLKNVKNLGEMSFGNNSSKKNKNYTAKPTNQVIEKKDYTNYTYSKPRLESKEHLWQKAPLITQSQTGKYENKEKVSEMVDKGKVIKYQL